MSEDPKKKPATEAPKGYKPLSVQQRKDWNDFLDFMEKEGVGGKPELDKRDNTLGLSYLEKYKKMNPKSTVTADIIPHVQYEQQLLRKGDSFPDLTPEEFDYIKKGVNPAYFQRPVSDVDGWLGSLTSRQYYITAKRGSNSGEKWDFGTDWKSFYNSLKDPKLGEKYLVK